MTITRGKWAIPRIPRPPITPRQTGNALFDAIHRRLEGQSLYLQFEEGGIVQAGSYAITIRNLRLLSFPQPGRMDGLVGALEIRLALQVYPITIVPAPPDLTATALSGVLVDWLTPVIREHLNGPSGLTPYYQAHSDHSYELVLHTTPPCFLKESHILDFV